MHLLFVGDGERDAATVPLLVERIMSARFESTCRRWARLNGKGKGYMRKTLYALRVDRDISADGLVATLDTDKEKKGRRLRQMQEARDADREKHSPMPTALGEATPHGEAWLLDDPAAVRTAMNLANDALIPTVRRTADPKGALHELLGQSPRKADRPLVVWADIARELDPDRCAHGKRTGFRSFVEEVRTELQPLVSPEPR